MKGLLNQFNCSLLRNGKTTELHVTIMLIPVRKYFNWLKKKEKKRQLTQF